MSEKPDFTAKRWALRAEQHALMADFWREQLNESRERMTQDEENHHRAVIAEEAAVASACAMTALALRETWEKSE